ncbi:hypothetical protein KDA_66540 [Dictyobacter alpinus]|uniref:Uncharacterized protein n=1 Tax=Dictyobacter alpinus TaxID=2014873 RepID=A0A402BIK4_9CHLR|nr:hypothetical protein [Dictyobacter alpinus]GCE31170.1 hypothetical protein KDA_66540 [Dictyobacter alpinus]
MDEERISMPLHPSGGKLQMPVETEADVLALFEKALSLALTAGPLAGERYRRDIEDHFYYIGALYPQYVRPLHEAMVRLTGKQFDFFCFSFAEYLYLLRGASDFCVDHLMQRLQLPHQGSTSHFLESMLAAIGTPSALAAMAEYAERNQKERVFREMGFWLPGGGKSAVPRFTHHRRAMRFQALDEALSASEQETRSHPVGLPLSFIAEEPVPDLIVWHYVTLDLAQIDGLPATLFSQAHLVSSPSNGEWNLFCAISPQNRYTQATLRAAEDTDFEDEAYWRQQADTWKTATRGEVVLLPYDDRLIYCNGHTQQTEGVYGDVGGPPLGLAEPPNCPVCHRLMFHVCTVTSGIRAYGDGFRSLFLCEDCNYVASQAMGCN